jgi:hypothetical protein
MLPAGSGADIPWIKSYSAITQPVRVVEWYDYNSTTGSEVSEALNVSQCTRVSWSSSNDAYAATGTDTGTGIILGCPQSDSAVSECTRLGSILDSSIVAFSDLNSTSGLPGNLKYIRAQTFADPGTALLKVRVECEREEVSDFRAKSEYDSVNRLLIDFSDMSHVSCNGSTCAVNDSLTPLWVRSAIGSPTSDTLAFDTTWQSTGGVIDPGATASTGVQYALHYRAGVSLPFAARYRIAAEDLYLRATFWRTGTTAVVGVGLCASNTSNVAEAFLTTAGASASTTHLGVIWNTSGNFQAVFQEGASSDSATTSGTYDPDGVHEVVIRTNKRVLGLDSSGKFDLIIPGTDYIQIEVDGVVVNGIAEDAVALPATGLADQMVPCISAVNVGGTSDTVTFTEIEWVTNKERSDGYRNP